MKTFKRSSVKALVFLVLMAGFELLNAQGSVHKAISVHSTNISIDSYDVLGNISHGIKTSSGIQAFIDDWFLVDTTLNTIPPEEKQQFPEMAFGDSVYLVVWQDNRSGDFYINDNDVYAARITPDGEVLDPFGIQISARPGIAAQDPSVAFDGTNFLVIWSENRDASNDFNIYGARVSPDGEVLDPDGFEICNAASYQILTGISFNGTHYLAAWSDFRPGNHDIYGARIDPDGTILEPNGFPIYSAPDNQAYVTVESNGSDWLLSWGALGEVVIVGTRVSADGNVLDPNGFIISSDADQRIWPDISFDGTNYMVVWADSRTGQGVNNWSVYGARVAGDGTVLDPDGIPIAADDTKFEGVPELCFDGTNYLVTWKDDGNENLTAAIVAPDGSIQAPGEFTISGADGFESYHAVGHDGTNWLNVWCDYRAGENLYGSRVDPSGNVMDPYPDDILVNVSGTPQYYPDADFDGTNHLVVWQEFVEPGHYDIQGTRMTADGATLDSPSLQISVASEDQIDPDIASGNSLYLAVWKDCRTTVFGSIYAARIAEDGTVLDPDGILINSSIRGQRLPAVAFDGTNFLVIWWEYGSDFEYHVYGSLVSEDGTVQSPGKIDIAKVYTDYGWNYWVDLSVSFNGENYLATWTEYDTDQWEIYGSRVTPDGVVLDSEGLNISSSVDNEAYSQVTTAGGQWLVAWVDGRNSSYDIYGTRVDADGTVLDPDGIEICTYTGDQDGIKMDFDGHHYVILWYDYRDGLSDIYGSVVDLEGNVLDPDGIVFSASPYLEKGPAISSGTNGESLVFKHNFDQETFRATRVWGALFSNPHIGIDDGEEQLASAMLSNVPNPFTSTTKVIVDLPENGNVQIKIYDMTGRLVSTLHEGYMSAGQHELTWNPGDEGGPLPESGIYLCRLSGIGLSETLKMVAIP